MIELAAILATLYLLLGIDFTAAWGEDDGGFALDEWPMEVWELLTWPRFFLRWWKEDTWA